MPCRNDMILTFVTIGNKFWQNVWCVLNPLNRLLLQYILGGSHIILKDIKRMLLKIYL